jgi:hypothetical protein
MTPNIDTIDYRSQRGTAVAVQFQVVIRCV